MGRRVLELPGVASITCSVLHFCAAFHEVSFPPRFFFLLRRFGSSTATSATGRRRTSRQAIPGRPGMGELARWQGWRAVRSPPSPLEAC